MTSLRIYVDYSPDADPAWQAVIRDDSGPFDTLRGHSAYDVLGEAATIVDRHVADEQHKHRPTVGTGGNIYCADGPDCPQYAPGRDALICDCGKGDYCPQYGEAIRQEAAEAGRFDSIEGVAPPSIGEPCG